MTIIYTGNRLGEAATMQKKSHYNVQNTAGQKPTQSSAEEKKVVISIYDAFGGNRTFTFGRRHQLISFQSEPGDHHSPQGPICVFCEIGYVRGSHRVYGSNITYTPEQPRVGGTR
jgi:hypothetical protein